MSYFKDLDRVRGCSCPSHRRPGKCGTKTKDVDPAPGVMAGPNSESQAINTARPAISNQGMKAPPGAQEAYSVKKPLESSEEPESEEDEACEKEKSVGDRIRQAHASKDVHKRNFLSAFYKGRANERASRQK
jgi:hypothetical protein